jgi:hypothetical protein
LTTKAIGNAPVNVNPPPKPKRNAIKINKFSYCTGVIAIRISDKPTTTPFCKERERDHERERKKA